MYVCVSVNVCGECVCGGMGVSVHVHMYNICA